MKVLVMGTGSYYQKKKAGIQGDIIAFVDNFKEGEYEGKKIIRPVDTSKYDYDRIYIMSVHFISMGYQLLGLGVERGKICFGANIEPYNDFERNFISENNQIVINNDNKICYKTPEIEIAVNTFDELSNIREIYGEYSYRFFTGDDSKKCVLMDIGANIAGASVWFAQMQQAEAVYAYEPFMDTVKSAMYNISNNPSAAQKVELFPYGLGTEEEKKTIGYNPGMTCGLSTLKDINQKAFNIYKGWGMVSEENNKECEIVIKDICKEIEIVINKHPGCLLVIKMDCEGSEYGMVERMHDSGLLSKVSILMLEWHYNGSGQIEKRLKENGFTWFSFGKSETLGTIYAVNKEKL